MDERYDVVVIGGGAAGLNGALMLARSRRSVLVIDDGRPRNAPAHGVHGLIGREGMPPAELLARGRDEVRSYGGDLVTGAVTGVVGDSAVGDAAVGDTAVGDTSVGDTAVGDTAVGDTAVGDTPGFAVTMSDGSVVRGRRLLVTTGLVDELPPVPGLRERWGRDVLHCPYCHGWEVRDQAIGVLAGSARSVHQALLFRQLSDDVVYFTHESTLAPQEQVELSARGIAVVQGAVAAVETVDDRLTGVRLVDGTVVTRQALAVSTRLVGRADFLSGVGLRPVEHPSGSGLHLPVDALGRTEVPGIWAAGNVADPFAQVGASAAGGAFAGAQINADLVTEETRAAVEALRMAV